MKFFSLLLVLTYVYIVHASCEEIQQCNECLRQRCVWYGKAEKNFCGKSSAPRNSYTTKTRSVIFCASRVIDLDQNKNATQTERTYASTTTRTSKSISKGVPVATEMKNELLIESQLSTTLSSATDSSTQNHNPATFTEGTSTERVTTSRQMKHEEIVTPTQHTSERSEVLAATSSAGSINDFGREEKKAKLEVLRNHCKGYASFKKIRLARKGKLMTKEQFQMVVRKCFRTML